MIPFCDPKEYDLLNFCLEGEDLDIGALDGLFKEESNVSKMEDGRRCVVMQLPFAPSDAHAARDAAQKLVSKLNGIAQVVHGNHESVRIGAVYCRERSDGPTTRLILPRTGRIRSRGGVPIVVVGLSPPAQELRGDRLLDAADRDEHFERALYLYGGLPQDWRCLYMVSDAAKDGNGGEEALVDKKWVAKGAINAFKRTANSFKAVRLQSRHGSISKGIARPEQTLGDANDMIRTVLQRWGEELLRRK